MIPHLRDLPELAALVTSTCLHPCTWPVEHFRRLDIVADVEGFLPGWWGGCVYRREPLWRTPELWIVVVADPMRVTRPGDVVSVVEARLEVSP